MVNTRQSDQHFRSVSYRACDHGPVLPVVARDTGAEVCLGPRYHWHRGLVSDLLCFLHVCYVHEPIVDPWVHHWTFLVHYTPFQKSEVFHNQSRTVWDIWYYRACPSPSSTSDILLGCYIRRVSRTKQRLSSRVDVGLRQPRLCNIPCDVTRFEYACNEGGFQSGQNTEKYGTAVSRSFYSG